MRKRIYQSEEPLSERTRPVERVFRFVFDFKRVFANGFTVLLLIGVLLAGIKDICVPIDYNVFVGSTRDTNDA